ncbi:putative glycosyltransferase domain protein [Bordetella holmesii ATCC 51541]|nr:putative glycosyltransferase domain protein [Bordetella holmesii ATCC 51541]
MSDPPLRARLGAEAVSVRERFSARHVLSLWQKLFDDALGRSST